ncbi:uncharacterized protein LOC134851260 [Symsagittifera roscoffensis]|uniref:uncharacterized protein LOC134851260 n=1 Tax=Symsagittifera roscoffensis TaxID=84072 RepID=UPI00307C024A
MLYPKTKEALESLFNSEHSGSAHSLASELSVASSEIVNSFGHPPLVDDGDPSLDNVFEIQIPSCSQNRRTQREIFNNFEHSVVESAAALNEEGEEEFPSFVEYFDSSSPDSDDEDQSFHQSFGIRIPSCPPTPPRIVTNAQRCLRFLKSSDMHGAFAEVVPYSHFVYYALLPADVDSFKALLYHYVDKYKNDQMSAVEFRLNSEPIIQSGRNFPRTTVRFFRMAAEELQSQERSPNLGVMAESDCDVCGEMRILMSRSCCNYNICNECMAMYTAGQVVQKYELVSVECPNCRKCMHTEEVRYRLKYSLFQSAHEIYQERIREVALSSSEYFCPHCRNILQAHEGSSNARSKILKTCSSCGTQSCSRCRVPWHTGMSCKRYQEGERSMRQWARGTVVQRNAVQCPGCRRWYQKSDGCDHMSCKKCRTEFCYSCGRKYRSIKFIGSHTSSFSVLGCKNNFMRGHPVLRETIRGSILAGAVAVAPVVVPVAAVGGAGLLVVIGSTKLARAVVRKLR